MSNITHITIPIELYSDRKLCEVKRAILALVIAFGDNGLFMSDDRLADIFYKSRTWINRCINELEVGGYVKIEKPGSRYRKIYCKVEFIVKCFPTINNTNSTVNFRTLSSKVEFTQKEISREDKNAIANYPLTFILKDGSEWYLSQVKFEQYQQAYPALDIEQELRKSAIWLDDNPTKRKTAGGMPRFLSGWLGRVKPSVGQQHETEDWGTAEEADAMAKEAYGCSA